MKRWLRLLARLLAGMLVVACWGWIEWLLLTRSPAPWFLLGSAFFTGFALISWKGLAGSSSRRAEGG